MFAKAEELKKTFAKKPKIKGKVGQDTSTEVQADAPASETPATEIPAEEQKQ